MESADVVHVATSVSGAGTGSVDAFAFFRVAGLGDLVQWLRELRELWR